MLGAVNVRNLSVTQSSKTQLKPQIAWCGGAATRPELVLQKAAEDTEEMICPLITDMRGWAAT